LTNLSVSSRFAVSALANLLRAGLAFITTVIIARVFGPEMYGDYAFLMGTFVATMGLLTLGTASAFQTFMSQKERGKIFVISYAGWQLLQILLVVLVIGIILPEEWLNQIWLGHERGTVLVAGAAVFMQQRAWRTMIQIGESKRLTQRVQMLSMAIAVVHFVLVVGFWTGGMLSIRLVFGLILAEHLIFLFVAYKVLFVSKLEGESFDGRSVLLEYVKYCSPLILYSIVGFGYEFADRWMLQNFGGSKQQGLYEVGVRFGMVSLLITASLINVFWKEIAEAKEKENLELMQKLYRKASRFLFWIGAVLAGFLIPWCEEIIRFMLGPSYAEGSLVLAIMLIVSAFGSLSQINGSMLLALGKTKAHFAFGSIFMGVSIPCSYFILASKDAYLPGLQLGSIGLAAKMLVFVILHANIVSRWISRDYGWKFDWAYQVIALGGALGLGWLSFELVEALNSYISVNLFFKGGLTLLLYGGVMGMMTWQMPWIAGTSRQDIKSYYFRFINLRFL
jgi:O-antigen/teichoic acid export membrane protein